MIRIRVRLGINHYGLGLLHLDGEDDHACSLDATAFLI